MDLTAFIDADIDLYIDRRKIRNQCIPGYTKEEIELRCDMVDRANALIKVDNVPMSLYKALPVLPQSVVVVALVIPVQNVVYL